MKRSIVFILCIGLLCGFTNSPTGYKLQSDKAAVFSTVPFTTNQYEDFSSWTKVEGDATVTVTSNRITWTNVETRNHTSYVYKDYGVNYFDDFTHYLTVYTGTGNVAERAYVWQMSDYLGDTKQQEVNVNGNYLAVRVRNYGGCSIGIWSGTGGGQYIYASFSDSTVYYLTIQRSGTSATLKIYSDSNRTTQVGSTMSITCDTEPYRYLYVSASNNDAVGGTYNASFYAENLVLTP